jgi:hypothetical protein
MTILTLICRPQWAASSFASAMSIFARRICAMELTRFLGAVHGDADVVGF